MRTHYGPWQPCWISNQHQKHKSGSGPSNEHFWQVWFNSVPWFQTRRFKCEKLKHGWSMLSHDKSSYGLWPGELIKGEIINKYILYRSLQYTMVNPWCQDLQLRGIPHIKKGIIYTYKHCTWRSATAVKTLVQECCEKSFLFFFLLISFICTSIRFHLTF